MSERLFNPADTYKPGEPGYQLRQTMIDENGDRCMCVLAGSAIDAGHVVHIDEDGTGNPISASVNALGDLLGVAKTAIANGDRGWLHRTGTGTIKVKAAVNANTALYTSADAGEVGPSGGSAEKLNGIVLTANGANDSTTAAVWEYPVCG